jgi:hypothetical protein
MPKNSRVPPRSRNAAQVAADRGGLRLALGAAIASRPYYYGPGYYGYAYAPGPYYDGYAYAPGPYYGAYDYGYGGGYYYGGGPYYYGGARYYYNRPYRHWIEY